VYPLFLGVEGWAIMFINISSYVSEFTTCMYISDHMKGLEFKYAPTRLGTYRIESAKFKF
jgi:hypothetical protein